MTAHMEAVRKRNIAESCRLVEDALDTMEANVVAQDTAIEGIAEVVREVLEKVDEAKSVAADASAEVSTLEREIESAQDDIKELDNNLDELKDKLTHSDSEHDDLVSDVRKLEKRMHHLDNMNWWERLKWLFNGR